MSLAEAEEQDAIGEAVAGDALFPRAEHLARAAHDEAGVPRALAAEALPGGVEDVEAFAIVAHRADEDRAGTRVPAE